MNEHHEMILETTYPYGTERWVCSICKRCILLMVPLDNEMIVVEVGDPYADHSGSTGGLRITCLRANTHRQSGVRMK